MDASLDLSAARKRLGLTQSALADRWGVDLATIWRWENRGIPTRGASRKLVDALISEASVREAAA
ncbi:helix-turn-helix domain-containing protein [Aureimonas psammosilenae]|uniref:helix-turn-helix domain-containing protein n=1 Tax=Aureimonas psammosilenae TaxID=2495496 RepID=UPI00126076E8|nr:helix-turn-helix transcriptional regulator [Aureimonas psammosilenae]